MVRRQVQDGQPVKFAIPTDEWLQVLEDEYLSTFVKDGGATVKFAVTPDDARADLVRRVSALCEDLGYCVLTLSADDVRMHMPHEIFFDLARQIDWPGMVRRVVLRLAAERGYKVSEIDPHAHGRVFESIAEENGLDHGFVLGEIRKSIRDHVARSPAMLRDFRDAMTYLCLHEVVDEEHPLLLWLRGEARVSSVRDYSVFTRIDRTTARQFIESTLHWSLIAGYTGTALVLDIARVTVARNPKDGRRYYTRAMATDHYELLREFVDDVDRLPGTFLCAVAGPELLNDERGTRGFAIYEALKTRVMDDVHDKRTANPLSSLVRLQAEAVT